MENEKTLTYEVTAKRELSASDVKDILTDAIEGGIGYWACLRNDLKDWEDAREECRKELNDTPCYCDVAYKLLSTGRSVWFEDAEDEDERYELTWDKLVNGCKQWEEWKHTSLPYALEECDFDSEDADCLIQFALFNDIIFG